MSGLSRAFIDNIISRTDIVSVVGSRVNLIQTGHSYKGLCPFHEEKTPSFTVNSHKQFFHCFGCGVSGDVIKFISLYQNISFMEAMNDLAHMHGLKMPQVTKSENSEEEDKWKQSLSLLNQAREFYNLALRNHQYAKEAQNYLKSRAINSETVETFALGFAPPERNALYRLWQNNSDHVEIGKELGLIKTNDNGIPYDQLRKRIVFPIRDSQGRVRGFGGRALEKEQQPKYINSSESLIFHKSNMLYGLYESLQHRNPDSNNDSWLVVEGYMDVISLHNHGFHKAIACLGTTINSQQIQWLGRYSSSICFAFDGDNAGQRAAEKTMKTCLPLVHDEKEFLFAILPTGEDPDSLVQTHGKERLRKLITQEALPLSEMFIHWLHQQGKSSTIEGKAKMASIGQKELAKVPNSFFRQIVDKRLRELTNTHYYSSSRKQAKPSIKNEKIEAEENKDIFQFIALAIANRSSFIEQQFYKRLAFFASVDKQIPIEFLQALNEKNDKEIPIMMIEHLEQEQIIIVEKYSYISDEDSVTISNMNRLFSVIQKRYYNQFSSEQKREYIGLQTSA